MINIRKLESELWESADLLRAGSKLTSNQYCMPVLGLIFLRYAFSRFKLVEAEILKDRPVRNGQVLPVEESDFASRSALFLPREAQYAYLVDLPENISAAGLTNRNGQVMNSLGEVVNNAMELVEEQSEQLSGVLPKDYTMFSDELLAELLRIFNNSALDDVGGDVIGRIYEYFLNKFAKNIAQLCLMNLAVHGLSGVIKSGDEANTFYHDAHNLDGCCDYVMANPPFNVDKVKAESAQNAGRLPFGMPAVNKNKEVSNANYLWISYFYSYLNEHGRAGFVMASSATDSQSKDKDIREKLVRTGHVDVMISVGNNFFYTKSLPCSLWFFDKGKQEELRDKVLFIDARNYYTVVDRTLNEWSGWQLKNLNAIVWLYRGEVNKYQHLLSQYRQELHRKISALIDFQTESLLHEMLPEFYKKPNEKGYEIKALLNDGNVLNSLEKLRLGLEEFLRLQKASVAKFAPYLEENKLKHEIKALIESRAGKGPARVRFYVKELKAIIESHEEQIQECVTVLKEADWLYGKFGEGVYADIPGLCKAATLEEIEQKGFSLTPGAYVGVPPAEDDGVDFHERMTEIHKELLELQAESNRLMETISKNWGEMGL